MTESNTSSNQQCGPDSWKEVITKEHPHQKLVLKMAAQLDYENLQTEISRLTAERDEWKDRWGTVWGLKNNALNETERLRAALQKYGGHKNDWQCAGGCLCGFSAALAGVTDETSKSLPDG